MNPELDVPPQSREAILDRSDGIIEAAPAALSSPSAADAPRLRIAELFAWLAIVVLADIAIYRGGGFTGWAAVFSVVPLLLAIGARARHLNLVTAVMGMMLVLAALRLVWCGSGLLTVTGCVLLAAFGLALAGRGPYFEELAAFVGLLGSSGARWFGEQAELIGRRTGRMSSLGFVSLFIPLIVLMSFAVLFVLANPDLAKWLQEQADQALEQLANFLANGAPHLAEVLFCVCAAWIAAGMLRPKLLQATPQSSHYQKSEAISTPAFLFPAFRNTLIAVSGLFAVYLVFEFQTLWFRKFPEGFHYSGYAHEGAAWLTVALALSTLILSAIFQGEILSDPRLPQLRRLAWIWSLENFILVAAVYHRLFIYIGFNGMTWMRVVGLFGITTVAAGFAIVLWKIAHNRDFLWLVRRQLWALGIAVYLFCLTPVDALTTRYNVDRILAGDPAPCVQLSVHRISAEGLTALLPLTECSNESIREGIKALLAEKDVRLHERSPKERHWSQFQISEQLARQQLSHERARWSEYLALDVRENQLRQFHKYAYQWY